MHDHGHGHHAGAAVSGAPAQMVKDPVCGMAVAEGLASFKQAHGGKTYHFCSEHCRARFAADPEAYLGTVAAPAPETGGITIDWLAPVYDRLCRAIGLGMALRRRTVELAKLKPGDHVLDVGCGTGVLTRLTADAVGPSGKAVGIDPGPRMIGIARRNATRTGSRAAFELGVIERLAYDDGAFDAVLSSFMLHHLPAEVKRSGLGELRRVLKPGGRLVLVDFDPTWPMARGMLAMMKLVPAYAHVVGAAGDPVPLLREAGFADVRVAGGWRGMASLWVAEKPAGTRSR